MTSTTNRDARERLRRASLGHDIREVYPTILDGWNVSAMQADLRDLLANQPLRGDEGSDQPVAWRYETVVPGHIERRIWQVTASTTHAEMLLESGVPVEPLFTRSDQPLPSVATGHPEQGALLSGWRDISTAPTDGTAVDVWLAPVSADGTPLLPCRVPNAYCSAESREDVWYVRGERTDHRIWGRITHWMPLPSPPLPADGSGHGTESTTDASQASGTNPKPPRQGGE